MIGRGRQCCISIRRREVSGSIPKTIKRTPKLMGKRGCPVPHTNLPGIWLCSKEAKAASSLGNLGALSPGLNLRTGQSETVGLWVDQVSATAGGCWENPFQRASWHLHARLIRCEHLGFHRRLHCGWRRDRALECECDILRGLDCGHGA